MLRERRRRPRSESRGAKYSQSPRPICLRGEFGFDSLLYTSPSLLYYLRKRAKTEDEKEQRRVERVLRNRRAAQSSRERKRQEVEALEKRNQELEALLEQHKKQTMMLMEELNKMRRSSGVVATTSSPLLESFEGPVTLSQPLFGASEMGDGKPSLLNDFILIPDNEGTVDPASISPELAPVPDDAIPQPAPLASAKPTTTLPALSDATQHPAAVLCDLQCPSVKVPESLVAQQSPQPVLALYLQLQMLLMASSAMLSACQQPILLIAGALKHNLVLQATPSILSTIIWMVTLPQNYRNSTSHNSLTTISAAQLQARPRDTPRSLLSPNLLSVSSTLRLKSLQKILTSSPMLARPLKDATLGLLRLVSEGHDDRVERLASRLPGIKGDQSRGPLLWPEGASLPSREALLTLLWAIRMEERNMKVREATIVSQPASDRPGSSVPQNKINQTFVLSVSSSKRKRDVAAASSKRLRLHY
jgi:transcriptional activator HAC1